jgi:nitroreductase
MTTESVPTASHHKSARTARPLHPLLAQRWSPRAFDAGSALTGEQATALLEAARWAPSANNSQPWRFLLARRGGAAFDRLFATLAAGNQVWAGEASALVLVAAQVHDADGTPMPWARYDTGQAVAHLSTQAEHEGLAVHQLGGFDAVRAAAAFGLDESLAPVVVLAVGSRATDEDLPEPFAARERAPRERQPLDDLLLSASDPIDSELALSA